MAEQHRSEKSIFLEALEKTDAAERAAFLDAACGDNSPLRAEVEALFRAHAKPQALLDAPEAAIPTIDQPSLHEAPGTVIGPYKLIEPIGEGGMGSVWMAQQTAPVKRLVALKLIKAGMDSKQVIARFEAERQALALMDHANIARVLDGGTTSAGRPYFVMDLVKGVPITRYCDEHHFTLRQRLELFMPVCQAVQHAHQKGIIHRDLKPSNVLVALYDGKPVPKVIDFGVAKAAGQALTDKTLVTGFGNIVGTLEYMSPEQAEINQLDIDTRSDIYALGVLLYELLAGSPPFTKKELEKAGMLEMLRVIREQEPSKPSTKLSTAEGLPTLAANRGTEPARLTKLVRGELDWIVMKALEKDRNRRYETANGFAMDVQRYLADEPVQACPPSAWYRFGKLARRNKVALTTMALVALTLLLGAAVSAWQAVRATEAEGRVTRESVEKERALEGKLGAEKERAEAATERANALEKWRQTAYYLKTALAFNEYRANNLARAGQLLDECPEDLKNWEWHYLKRLCHSELSSVLLGTGFVIRSAPLTPDGSRVAIRTGDVLYVYDTATGQEVLHLAVKGHSNFADLAISPDGKKFALGGAVPGKYVVYVWEADTGKEIAVLKGLDTAGAQKGLLAEMWGVAVSPDGRKVAGSDMQGNLFVWDTATGSRRLQIDAHSNPSPQRGNTRNTTVNFNPDGTWLATACKEQGIVKIWDAEKGTLVRSLGQADGFEKVVFSSKGTWVAAAGWRLVGQVMSPLVCVWNAKTGQSRLVFPQSWRATCLAFSPDETRLAVGSYDTTLTIWDLPSGKEFATYRGHAGSIASVAFSADGTRLLSLGGDGLVKSWNATRAPEVLILKGGLGTHHAALSSDGRLVAAAALDNNVYVWEADTGKQLQKFVVEDARPWMVAFSPDGVYLAAAAAKDATGYVRVWEVKTGKLLHTLTGPAQGPGPATAAVAFSPDGKRLASGGLDRAVRIWDVATGNELRLLPGHTRSVTGLAFSRDGRRLVSGSGGMAFGSDDDDLNPLKLKPDDKTVIPELKVWDLDTGRENLNLSLKGKGRAVAISPDGDVVAAALGDNTVRLYHVATGQEVLALKGHSRRISGIAFSPDGKRLVTGGGWDESVKLWDAQTGEEILTVGRATSNTGVGFSSIGFSADGRRIVASSIQDIRVWDATPLPRK
jgi:WD40 repeat protein/serine/threonine protein kinase